MQRSAAYAMLARVRDELETVRYSLSVVARGWHEHLAGQPQGGRSLSIGDVRRCLENLEVTYTLRLFATYEAILRDFWLNGLRRRTEPDLKPLMDAIAVRRQIDPASLATARQIRDLRNRVMHSDIKGPRFDFGYCAKALGRYLAWLPPEW